MVKVHSDNLKNKFEGKTEQSQKVRAEHMACTSKVKSVIDSSIAMEQVRESPADP